MFHKHSRLLLIVALASCIPVFMGSTAQAIPAFPGAEGFGTFSAGGRGGNVYKVTTLSGGTEVGSLRWALMQPGPKTIVFDVSGVIDLGHKNYFDLSFTTIAGQTAPGGGITIAGQLLNHFSDASKPDDERQIWNHFIIRFVRFRYSGALDQDSDCLRVSNIHDFIVDHCDMSWGADELLEANGSRRFTVQWCSIFNGNTEGGQSDGYHNYGMLSGYRSSQGTLHHNLFANNIRRNPYSGIHMLEHINNVAYNAQGMMHHYPKDTKNYDAMGVHYETNTIGNYFKDGPNYNRLKLIAAMKWKEAAYSYTRNANMYQNGNYFEWIAQYLDNPNAGYVDMYNMAYLPSVYRSSVCDGAGIEQSQPHVIPTENRVNTHTALDAYELVLDSAGSIPRDWVLTYEIDGVKNGTGVWGRHDPPGGDLMYGLTPKQPEPDADSDGMPDNWEIDRGLNPNDPADRNTIVPAGASPDDRHKGYTYLEYYINELADNLLENKKNIPPIIIGYPATLAAPTNLKITE